MEKFKNWLKQPKNVVMVAVSILLLLGLVLWIFVPRNNTDKNITSDGDLSSNIVQSTPDTTPSTSTAPEPSSSATTTPTTENNNAGSNTVTDNATKTETSSSTGSNTTSSGNHSSNETSSNVSNGVTPTKKGHWEKVWVSNWVTIPGKDAVTKKVYVCHVKKAGGQVVYTGHSTDECGNKIYELGLSDPETSYNWSGAWQTVVVEPAVPAKKIDQGHYENRWVDDN